MAKKKTKKTNFTWFQIGLIGILLVAPNATVIKYTTSSLDPFVFNAIRFLLVAALTTPFIFLHFKRINRKNFINAIKAGIFLAIAGICFVWSIKLSQASYVGIITLITPIVFILYSVKMTGEKITYRAITGITLAVIGAMCIVLLPIALKQNGTFVFYPFATFLALVNVFTFPLAIIYSKKANEGGLSMPSLISISSWVIFTVNFACIGLFGVQNVVIGTSAVWGILYSGIVTALIGRIMNVTSYEHIGAVVSSALGYFETFLAILIPIVILNEKLSAEMIIGGIFILAGVWVVEYKKSAQHRHHYIFRSH